MKFLLTIAVLMMSMSAMAFDIRTMMNEEKVIAAEEKMVGKGFVLANVVDTHATRGVFPRCACYEYVLNFSKGVMNEQGTMDRVITPVSVSITGHGATKKVTVRLPRL